MSINVMNQYIELTKKEANDYIKAILGSKFNKKISDKYKEKYINIRYYNFNEKDYEEEEEKTSFKKNLAKGLTLTEEELIEEMPEKKEIIEKLNSFYYFFLNLDNFTYGKELEEDIDKLCDLREKLLNKDDIEFKKNAYEIINKYNKGKSELLAKFENNEDFYIKTKPYHGISNVNKVVIKHNVKLPMIYSLEAIEKAFNTGIINEDKLIIEYYLITVEIIKEIAKENFKKQYILEFAPTLFKKKKKLKSLLNIIDNDSIKDKLSLKIKYSDFLKEKENIYELTRKGLKVAIVLDEEFAVNFMNLEKLNIFSYIIVNKKLRYYEELLENRVVLNNLIEI